MTPPVQLASLVGEDLRSSPGPALADALARLAADPRDAQAQLDACLASLAAGEAKRALALLQAGSLQTPRVTAALISWGRLADGNRYPGEIGAETASPTPDSFVTVSPGTPLEMLLEHLDVFGPQALTTPRTLIEHALRAGNAPGVQQAVGIAIGGLQTLGNAAVALGIPAVAQWATLAGADVFHRAGMPDWQPWLQQARAIAADPAQLALTFLVEGDWHAAPGSSPEAMGWDLAPMNVPSPLGTSDLPAAAACWTQAAGIADAAAPPRLAAALALRRSLLARASGDSAARRGELDAAAAAYTAAGDGAGIQLVRIHRLIADIDEGVLAEHALHLGGGWRRPEHGPVAEVVSWGETVGSRSWCVGLSRLLERCGAWWMSAGSAPRARIAYLAALGLAGVERSFPSRSLVTAVAKADAQANLATNALLRLERGLDAVLADPDDPAPFAFAERLEASLVMVSALRAQARGPGARLAADRFDRLRTQLADALESTRARLPGGDAPLPTTMAELQAAVDLRAARSLEEQAAASERGFALMRRMQLDGVRQQLDTIDVLAPLTRADAARQAGLDDESERWSAAAVEAARRPGVAAFFLPLALVSALRLDEARIALAAGIAAGTIPDEFALPIALRAGDHATAEAALSRLLAAGRAPASWQDLLSQAEVELGRGDPTAARATSERAIDALEAAVALLLRDPERLDACDQPDVAALFTTLALAILAADGDAGAALEASERLRLLTAVETMDAGARDGGVEWRRAAASYSAVADSILAALPASAADEVPALFAELDAADRELAEAEFEIERASPGILLRRATPSAPPSAAELRERMPAGTLLLDYLAVGDDLLAWAMTKDAIVAHTAKLHLRQLTVLVRDFHRSCSAGRGAETPLAGILLDPFADLVRAHSRIVVVPFGPLTLVPFHALRFDGAPLGFTHTVSYATRASSAFGDGFDAPARRERPLVVGDPAFDRAVHPQLAPLPGSKAEAEVVAAALGVDDPLIGAAATEQAVTQRLDAAGLIHLSSHGHLDELSPFASSLVLAGADELTVAELTGVRFETDLAVLTGCDTGRGAATLGGDLIGLTRTLLRSGVRRAVVSLWPVDDAVAPVLMREFYRELAADTAPAEALATAQRAVGRMSVTDLRAAFAALGGGLSEDGSNPGAGRGVGTGARRGLDLDPELRDDEKVPEPLGGDAERFWAPFILVT